MTDPSPPSRRDSWVALAVIGTACAVLAGLTWRKWPDITVDYGLQLYCPWKLSTGSVLYRDVAYLVGGPLSQYYHAFLFKVFGVSFLTLVVSNLVMVAGLLLVVYRCFYRCSNQSTAVTVCLGIVAGFVFAQYTALGIFNYITPYCSEVVHGLVLSVFCMAFFCRWFREQKWWAAAGIGICGGLTFLTKPEVFAGLGISVCAGLLLFWRVTNKPGAFIRSLGIMLAAGLVPPGAFFVYFWRVTNFHDAWQSICAPWIPALTVRVSDNPYFLWCMGLDRPGLHLREMCLQFFCVMIIVVVAALVCRSRNGKLNWMPALLLGTGLAALAWKFDWGDSGAGLPLLCLTTLALLLMRAKLCGLEQCDVFPIVWTFFSLGLLPKLGLFCRIWHYGFVLGMPAFLCSIYLLLWLLPRELERFYVRTTVLRLVLWAPLMIGFGQLASHSLANDALKTAAVGSGADKMWVDSLPIRPQDTGSIMAVRWMEANTPPQATLAVLPSGIMINYLARRTNPCRYPVWPPPEIIAFGQQKMTDDFIRHSPDYIILVGTKYGEFGDTYFGLQKQFGGDLMVWIKSHYEAKYWIGDNWLQTGRFGMLILEKGVTPKNLLR